MEKTKGIGALLLLGSASFALLWIYWVAVDHKTFISSIVPQVQMTSRQLAILIPVGIGILALLGLLGWIGYTMATMKVEVSPPEAKPPEAPAAEKKP